MSLIFGIIGIIIGSFFNVCIFRIPKNESIVFLFSKCPYCNKKIKWYENIPLISYFFILKGRCSNCKEKISKQYPITELLTGILFFIFFNKFGLSLTTLKYIVLGSSLIIASFIDLKNYYIPNRVNFFILIFGIITSFSTIGLEKSLLGGGIYSLFFVLVYGYLGDENRNVIGFGDVKLALGIGVNIGYSGLYNVLIFLNIAFITGGIIGLILIILKKKTRKDVIPFSPYIAIAGVAAAYLI